MLDRRLGAGLTAVIAAVALAGCGGGASAPAASGGTGSTGTTGSTGGTGGTGDSIKIVNFVFTPGLLMVKSGQKVTVTNDDSAVHTITADDKSFDSKDLAKGKSYTFTAGKPGKYTYICDIHQYMKGTIEVS